ncbi:MAG: helix-turn-helix transcriptional regulator, partial [Clostridia bacterium]|nr:helix-turn-helix transcriptional regulator [Clostridia bacterium]
LQELRKQKGLTQEELAKHLYVSRAAISKWEQGRGYPGIDSLKAIASFFSLTVDELLCSNEVMRIAEAEQKKKDRGVRDLMLGLLDLSVAMLLFLPFFATRGAGVVQSSSLLALGGVQHYLKVLYFIAVIAMTAWGILTLALQGCQFAAWARGKAPVSLGLNAAAVLLFVLSLQPYAAVFGFAILSIKVSILTKR